MSATVQWRWALLLIACACAAVVIGWVGYSSSDDAAYYRGAIHWLENPPFAGDNHWTTRYPLEITLAAGIGLIGRGFAAMAIVALAWYGIFLGTTFWLARRIAGARAAWLATIVMATLPVVVANATTVACDPVEAVFLMIGIGLAGDLAAGKQDDWRAAVAGLAFAGAIFCRETTGLALFGLVPIFLLGRPIRRRALIVMGIAFFGLIAAEALYQWLLTGDPLNRWTLALHHDSHIDRAANLEGNFLLWPPIDPLLVLLVNNDFSILFWLAGAAVAGGVTKALDPAARRRLLILFALAAASFLLVGLLYTKLVLNPRYFMLPALCAAVVLGAWLDRLRAVPRMAILAVLVALNLLLIGLGNAHPRWNAEALILAETAHPGETIHTDHETLHRAQNQMTWQGLSNGSATEAGPGALYLGRAEDRSACDTIVQRFASPPTFWGRVLDAAGLSALVPAALAPRLFEPNPAMLLFRRAGDATGERCAAQPSGRTAASS